MTQDTERVRCQVCGKVVRVRADGELVTHKAKKSDPAYFAGTQRCPGSRMPTGWSRRLAGDA